jgi:multidrug resistance efflux pump
MTALEVLYQKAVNHIQAKTLLRMALFNATRDLEHARSGERLARTDLKAIDEMEGDVREGANWATARQDTVQALNAIQDQIRALEAQIRQLENKLAEGDLLSSRLVETILMRRAQIAADHAETAKRWKKEANKADLPGWLKGKIIKAAAQLRDEAETAKKAIAAQHAVSIELHGKIVKNNVKLISQSKNSAQIVICVNGKSYTRHVRVEAGKYVGNGILAGLGRVEYGVAG